MGEGFFSPFMTCGRDGMISIISCISIHLRMKPWQQKKEATDKNRGLILLGNILYVWTAQFISQRADIPVGPTRRPDRQRHNAMSRDDAQSPAPEEAVPQSR